MSIIIDARHLSKTFVSATSNNRHIKALDDLSIQVKQGETLGLLGPNGAGKTTFLNVLSTLLIPDSGVVYMDGIAVTEKNFTSLRKIFNMSSGYPNFPFSLTMRENLYFYGRLYGLSNKALDHKVDELITLFEIETFSDRRFDELSSGNKQRLALAKALLNDPKIIFLDEPTVGLDPDVAIKLRSIITNVLRAKGVTVLLTTHNMLEAEEMCDRVAFIKSGKILQLASPQELKRSLKTDDLDDAFIQLAKTSQGSSILALNAPQTPVVEAKQVHTLLMWAYG
jgi:ABC-2 type transport system ATP-binding protein